LPPGRFERILTGSLDQFAVLLFGQHGTETPAGRQQNLAAQAVHLAAVIFNRTLVFPERLPNLKILAFRGALHAVDIRVLSNPETHQQSSSRLMKKRDVPGSPCRPARPRSWLSIRLAS
jgi:hypothetical protein